MIKKRTFLYYYCCGNGVRFKVYFVENIRICNEHFNRRAFRHTIAMKMFRTYEDAYEFSSRDVGNINNVLFLHMPWGYISSMDIHVYMQDYQGNNRAAVEQTRWAVQTTDYYPYGAPMATSTEASRNPYKYSGKEHETRMGLNQYDFHARNQLPTLGLFDQPDPKAGDYLWLNPYLYCAANPIAYIDPTGEDFKLIDNDIEYTIDIVDNNVSIYDTDNNIVDTSSLSNATQVLFEWLQKIVETNTGNGVVQEIIDSDETIYLKAITGNRNNFNVGDRTIYYNPYYSQSGESGTPGYDNRAGRQLCNLNSSDLDAFRIYRLISSPHQRTCHNPACVIGIYN